MPHVTLPAATVRYRESGPEDSAFPPVVFVHGALVDSRLWDTVAHRLAGQGFRCILPDLPLGSHTIPVTDRAALSPEGVADLLHDFLTALDLEDVTLVGNDTGGGLCQFLIDAHPERIGRLVLTNCDAFDKFPPFPFNAVFALMRTRPSVTALMATMGPTAMRHSALGFGLLAKKLDPDLTASWLRPTRTDRRIAGDFAALARGIGRTDLTHVAPRLHRFTKPVTVVWGLDDRCFTPALGRRLAALFPHCNMIEVPHASTFVSLDHPEAVSDAIMQTAGAKA
ncbi:putative hydrolase or acyltransferase of alpha/beta superfamily [Mycolicibacterium chubuense NBB4]|uniref:Putative hydrolase or acyltransferase of alpha/beta superfamily n=1 Tax=Mycolicibacterium chubuense (strain NBB4) TaxID=710421 RepID=I4BDC1_MYCCN|nr:alpha/beta hydrolase [Mycolicibacterium chubuense]AFM15278.1 putative hydrolase or acyltransferase of alpha/beta superfamily [Mycolicibacterium chubuense NBB4]